jgi:hypothetical protein
MSLSVTIQAFTANTPVQVYYCDSVGDNCQFVDSVSDVPLGFTVASPYDENNVLIKIIDNLGFEKGEYIFVTPTPTPSITTSVTPTVTNTPTNTTTPTPTPSVTRTQTPTPTIVVSPTPTLTPSSTPFYVSHYISRTTYDTSVESCLDTMTWSQYYTYISGATTTPVINSVIYEYVIERGLFSPFVGNNQYVKMQFGNDFYAVKINNSGMTTDYVLCTS